MRSSYEGSHLLLTKLKYNYIMVNVEFGNTKRKIRRQYESGSVYDIWR
jgi:hypothetical protein